MNIAILLSGGTGTRIKSKIPKQYIKINGRTIMSYSMETLLKCDKVDALFVVAAKEYEEAIKEEIVELAAEKEAGVPGFAYKFKGFCSPGENRQMSIYNGLLEARKIAKKGDKVIVHDAARPFVSDKLIKKCIRCLKDADGVMPALPMKDTVYISEDGSVISKLIDRKTVFAGQAPESYDLFKYLDACEALMPEKILGVNGSSEVAVMARMKVAIIDGDEKNFKITTDADLEKLESLI